MRGIADPPQTVSVAGEPAAFAGALREALGAEADARTGATRQSDGPEPDISGFADSCAQPCRGSWGVVVVPCPREVGRARGAPGWSEARQRPACRPCRLGACLGGIARAVLARRRRGRAGARCSRRTARSRRLHRSVRQLRQHPRRASGRLGQFLVSADRGPRLRRSARHGVLAALPVLGMARRAPIRVVADRRDRGLARRAARWRCTCSNGSRRSSSGQSWGGVRCCCSPSFPPRFSSRRCTRRALFLALGIGSFYAARRGHWVRATALAALTPHPADRIPRGGAAPTAVSVWPAGRSTAGDPPRKRWLPVYRPHWDIVGLALVPVGLVGYFVYLGTKFDDPS